jgi:membrane-bound metal-dependent hydrolase YbcI (DUF457 family)
MASPLGHGLIGVGIAASVVPIFGVQPSLVYWLGAVVASNVPDADLIGLTIGLPLNRTHRLATHSLLVLAGLLLLVYLLQIVEPRLIPPEYFLAWALALLSHPMLDVITTGPKDAASGFGIPLFWPLCSRRWAVHHPIYHSAPLRAYRSVKTLSRAILPELYWCVALSLITVSISYLVCR